MNILERRFRTRSCNRTCIFSILIIVKKYYVFFINNVDPYISRLTADSFHSTKSGFSRNFVNNTIKPEFNDQHSDFIRSQSSKGYTKGNQPDYAQRSLVICEPRTTKTNRLASFAKTEKDPHLHFETTSLTEIPSEKFNSCLVAQTGISTGQSRILATIWRKNRTTATLRDFCL